ncbi:MAG: PilZ domain-containing protein [Phycisphaerales bacterium]|nr:PilZ domain-containing protein [Phycisphaerales bacterium]
MPASRSRTERWRECFDQVAQRGGGIELSVADTSSRQGDLVWRVRLLRVTDAGLVVETPAAAGSTVPLPANLPLVGSLSIGQNRWMFHTSSVGPVSFSEPGRPPCSALQLAAPTGVERCSRRSFMRISTASMELAPVECWPLLDPTTVTAAEIANAAVIRECARTGAPWSGEGSDPIVLPEVGPRFTGRLGNISGGGLGLILDRENASGLDRGRLFWLRIDLRPGIAAPIGVTTKIAHAHLDSQQSTYAGMAFEFQFNPAHRSFVVEQITRLVSSVQTRARAAA